MKIHQQFLTFLMLVAVVASCKPSPVSMAGTGNPPHGQPQALTDSNQPSQSEITIQRIPLAGLASLPSAELSGLAWYAEWLILLPQYPQRFPGGAEGALLALRKQEIMDFLDGRSTSPLVPHSIPLIAPELKNLVQGYEGFEAIAIHDNKIFLAIESNSGNGMLTHLLSGTIAEDLSMIRLNTGFLIPIPAQAAISNFSDEALVMGNDFLFTLYEANGSAVNPSPVAHQFDLNLNTPQTIAMPNIEYRITDATPVDADGTFWAINYFYPGDQKILPTQDPIAVKFGKGKTHASFPQVERLVMFKFQKGSIQLADHPPIQLELVNAVTARNWEGLALLDGRGFLLVTDQYPETILAFAAFTER